MPTPDPTLAADTILNPHIGWAILCLVLALAAAIIALVIAGADPR